MTTHRINRVEIELCTGDVPRARALSERVGRMHGRRIAPVLDRVCSELGGSEEPIRLDRLEVDLGAIAADDLEEDFAAKLEPALRAALRAALARRAGGADPDRERARAALELLETFALTGGLPWWADPRDGAVVARHFARAATLAEAELVALVRRLARDPGALDRLARTCDGDALAALAALVRPASARPERAADLAGRRALLEELADREPRGTAAPHPIDDTPEPRRPATERATPEPRRAAAPDPLAVPPASFAAPAPRAASPSPRAATPPTPETPRPRLAPAPDAAIRAARRAALARLDELYVDDAGLVLLWPFLERLFARTGLLGDDRRFLDEAAQLSAVALAAALATADPEPPEVRLPLAKLLCGRPLESDFQLERPLTPEQLAEGERLLAAVIDHAPALGALSIPGLRAAFLQRPGALGTRDGAWLLQVERRAHDVVLDRLPWSWAWVKLPWMPEPLRVEW